MRRPAGSVHLAVVQHGHPSRTRSLAPPGQRSCSAAAFVSSMPGSKELKWDLAVSYGTKAVPGSVEGFKSDLNQLPIGTKVLFLYRSSCQLFFPKKSGRRVCLSIKRKVQWESQLSALAGEKCEKITGVQGKEKLIGEMKSLVCSCTSLGSHAKDLWIQSYHQESGERMTHAYFWMSAKPAVSMLLHLCGACSHRATTILGVTSASGATSISPTGFQCPDWSYLISGYSPRRFRQV